MDIKKFVSREYFISKINLYFESFYSRVDIQKCMSSIKLYDINELVQEFWDNPSQNIIDLKKRYQIVNGVSIYDIVKANSCEKHIDFLLDCWNSDISIENIIKKYSIHYNRIENILELLKLDLESLYCPECFKSTVVTIDPSIKDIRKKQIIIRCTNCQDTFSSLESFLTKIQVEEKMKTLETKRQEFQEHLKYIKLLLEEIRCYKCQDKLEVHTNDRKLIYYLKCTRCREIIVSVDDARDKYDKWRKQAAMLSAIKHEEKELIEKVLKSKKYSDVTLKKDEIIRNESDEVLNFFYKIEQKEVINGWEEIYKILKKCTRLSKLILFKILELCKEEGRIVTRSYTEIKKEFEVYRYSPKDKPVVISLYNKIEIVMLREELRKLIKKKLIDMDEEYNYIDVIPLLVDNLELIENMLRPQNINNDLRYIIFQRNNFTCTRCGSTERPLRVAYLTSDKNNHDLNLMTCVCDFCFDDVTEGEVLIDGTFSFETEYAKEEKLISWEFLISNFPMLKSNEKAYNEVAKLSECFDQLNIIKAFAITTDKIKNNVIEATVATLLRYTVGILNNSLEEIVINERLFKKYNMEEWFNKT